MPQSAEPSHESRIPPGRAPLVRFVLLAGVVVGVTFAALQVADEAKRRRLAALPQEFPLLDLPSAENFAPIQVVERVPPVSGFRTLDVDAANEVLDDDELVLAVEIDGQARAYPINMLTGPSREIINDQLAGTAIAATW